MRHGCSATPELSQLSSLLQERRGRRQSAKRPWRREGCAEEVMLRGSAPQGMHPARRRNRYSSSNNRKERPVTRSITFLGGAARLAVSLGGPAFVQGVPQTVTLTKVDPASLATGYQGSG